MCRAQPYSLQMQRKETVLWSVVVWQQADGRQSSGSLPPWEKATVAAVGMHDCSAFQSVAGRPVK